MARSFSFFLSCANGIPLPPAAPPSKLRPTLFCSYSLDRRSHLGLYALGSMGASGQFVCLGIVQLG
jgi:hypothetical protein